MSADTADTESESEADGKHHPSVHMKTPDIVQERVFHEKQIPPGAICRRHWENRDGEMTVDPWFLVLSRPEEDSSIGSEYIRVLWLDGEKKGVRSKKYLSDLGSHPPYRRALEKHDFEIPERYIAGPKTRVLLAFLQWLT